MARASSRTISYDIRSPTTDEARVIFERSYVKAVKVNGRYITATKQFAIFDTQGRRYERISDTVVSCVPSGERFHIVGTAERSNRVV
jgi:uncharacterized protein YxjI